MTKGYRKGSLAWGIAMMAVSAIHNVQAWNAPAYPGPEPGAASAAAADDPLVLHNNAIRCTWSVARGHLKPVSAANLHSGAESGLHDSECFQLQLTDGQMLNASALRIVRGPEIDTVPPDPQALRLGEQSGGKQIRATLAPADGNLVVTWRVVLRDGSNYVRQYVSLAARNGPVKLQEMVLVQLASPPAKPAGTLDGAPVVVGDMFFAFEHPLSKIQVPDAQPGAIRCYLPRTASLNPGDSQEYSSVMGVVPPGQLRRGFLYYVERERAQPYRPFLHYNSWYDIGYGKERIVEDKALQVVELFGKELIEARQVVMDSFVPDDGWDDPASLWRFHDGFPNGFTSLAQLAKQYHSGVGVWLSPWGGYGKAKDERMKYGRQEGFETNRNGFSMAGPKYYARFREVCTRMIRDYDLNYFKFDGISSGGTPTGAPAEFAADVEALLRLIGDLRRAKPNVFINVTTGTWSSPYWLWYADSTWRSGADWSTCGWGSKRQQQVTYRDAQTYQNVVCRAPLYPINSLMTQGIMFANYGLPDQADGLTEDIHAFFTSGTNCQELYITPALLSPAMWDVLAEAAKWSRANADVLIDTHWVGGDPAKGEVYGWASWSPRKAILGLRNPKDVPGRIVLDIGKTLELPPGAAQRYSLRSPWKDDAAARPQVLASGEEHTFELKPFEVIVFDATPL
jgi:hypothetical protein